MTIEQARQQIKAHRIPMEDLLDELEWYRKQDLIDRKGMKNRIIELVDSGLIRMYTDVLDAIDEYPKVDRGGVDSIQSNSTK